MNVERTQTSPNFYRIGAALAWIPVLLFLVPGLLEAAHTRTIGIGALVGVCASYFSVLLIGIAALLLADLLAKGRLLGMSLPVDVCGAVIVIGLRLWLYSGHWTMRGAFVIAIVACVVALALEISGTVFLFRAHSKAQPIRTMVAVLSIVVGLLAAVVLCVYIASLFSGLSMIFRYA